MKYFIANWKENKNIDETTSWISKFLELLKNNAKVWSHLESDKLKIIICPQHTLIYSVANALGKIKNLHIGAQNISHFDEGSYTGEVSARSIENVVDFVILGHSERRLYFNETEEQLARKVELARKYKLEPILCLRNENDKVLKDVDIIAYEPVAAIGIGKSQDLENIIEMKKKLNLNPNIKYIYGGSANAQNIDKYRNSSEIDGFLISTASLDPVSFFNAISSL